MDTELDIVDQAARLRALDVLSEQQRQIRQLATSLSPVQRRTRNAADELDWRAPSRSDFEARIAELGDRLVRVTVHLDDARDQCERARVAVLAGFPNGETVRSGPNGHSGYPAAPRPAPYIPVFIPRR